MSSSVEVVAVAPPPPFLENGLFLPTKALYKRAFERQQLFELTPPILPSHFALKPRLEPSTLSLERRNSLSPGFVNLKIPVQLPSDSVLVQNSEGELSTVSGHEALLGVKKFVARQLGAACNHLLRFEYDSAEMHLRQCAKVWTSFEYYVVTAATLKLREESNGREQLLSDLQSRATTQFRGTSIPVAIDAWSNSLVRYIRIRRHPEPGKNPLLYRESRFESEPFGFTPAY
jgi:hypothetical protein